MSELLELELVKVELGLELVKVERSGVLELDSSEVLSGGALYSKTLTSSTLDSSLASKPLALSCCTPYLISATIVGRAMRAAKVFEPLKPRDRTLPKPLPLPAAIASK